MKNSFIILALTLFFAACNSQEAATEKVVSTGTWLGELALNDSTMLSFLYKLNFDDGKKVTILNGSEEILLETAFENSDSIVLNFPVYQVRLCAKTGSGIWMGYLEKLDTEEEYLIPFVGSYGIEDRLPNTEPACCPLPKRWKVAFNADEKTTPAIGEFELIDNRVTGSFLTQSGDYRFLDGKLNGNKLTLFGFDGGYIQVFKATLKNDTLRGTYHSGLTGFKTWTATPNDTFQLTNPDQISELNPALDSISFSYPSLVEGQDVVYNPHAYLGEVVILQITGSWCPNCKDQAKYLQQLKTSFSSEGLEIMGIAFERMGTLEKSIAAAKKSKEDLEVDYPVGIATYNRKQVAEEEFPVFTKIRSYPTLIFIDKKGEIRKIYTGFAGPGTSRYEEETNALTQFIKDLLNE